MSYIIAFWDKSKLQISDEIAKKLQQAITGKLIDNFMIADNFYAVGGVEKIISKTDAYNVFPNETELLKNMEDKTATLPALESPKLNAQRIQ